MKTPPVTKLGYYSTRTPPAPAFKQADPDLLGSDFSFDQSSSNSHPESLVHPPPVNPQDSLKFSDSSDSFIEPPKRRRQRRKQQRHKRSYIPVTDEKRDQLTAIVQGPEHHTIKQAAQIMGMNYSTAKHIIKTYRASPQF